MKVMYSFASQGYQMFHIYSITSSLVILAAMIAACYLLLKLPYKRFGVIATVLITMFGFNAHIYITDRMTEGEYTEYREARAEFDSLPKPGSKDDPSTSDFSYPWNTSNTPDEERSLEEIIAELEESLKTELDEEDREFLRKGLEVYKRLERGEIEGDEFMMEMVSVLDPGFELTFTEQLTIFLHDVEETFGGIKDSFLAAVILLGAMIILDPLPQQLLARRRRLHGDDGTAGRD